MTPKKYFTKETKPKKFDPIAASSKIGICGTPIRVDAYSTCSYGCIYCESNNRAIMAHSDELKIGDIKALERRLHRVIDEGKVNPNDIVDHLIAEGHDWHLGGLSDPWQPCEGIYHIAQQIIALSVRYHNADAPSTPVGRAVTDGAHWRSKKWTTGN